MTSFRATRDRVVNGEEVRFHGRLRGRQTGETGKLLYLQVFTRGRWSTFATPRANRAIRAVEPAVPIQRDARTGPLSIPRADPARGELPVRDGASRSRPRDGARAVTSATLGRGERILRYMSRIRSHLSYANVMATRRGLHRARRHLVRGDPAAAQQRRLRSRSGRVRSAPRRSARAPCGRRTSGTARSRCGTSRVGARQLASRPDRAGRARRARPARRCRRSARGHCRGRRSRAARAPPAAFDHSNDRRLQGRLQPRRHRVLRRRHDRDDAGRRASGEIAAEIGAAARTRAASTSARATRAAPLPTCRSI